MGIFGKIAGLVRPEKGVIGKARKIQAAAKAILKDKGSSRAAMEACHSMMSRHLISIKLKINEYGRIERALRIAQSGAGNESQILKLKDALKKMDNECGSREHLNLVASEFMHVGDLLNERLNSL